VNRASDDEPFSLRLKMALIAGWVAVASVGYALALQMHWTALTERPAQLIFGASALLYWPAAVGATEAWRARSRARRVDL
jgi:hypothetical protein